MTCWGAQFAVFVLMFLALASHAAGDDTGPGGAEAGSSLDHLPIFTSSMGRHAVRSSDRMHLGANAAPWLPRMLDDIKSNRPPRWRLAEVALFDGADDRQYLATIWRNPYLLRTPRIEFHGVVPDADGRPKLHYYRHFWFDVIDLNFASGQGLFPGEAPVAVVGLLSLGSAPSGNSLRLIQMKRNTVDVTPDAAGRLVDMRDLDGDGTHEAISLFGHWAGYFGTTGAAGPYLPVVSAREGERFVPACRRFSQQLERDSRRRNHFGVSARARF